MTEVIILIERKQYDEQHWIKPAPKTGNTEQRYRVWLEGKDIGSWRVPECAAARWLLANGKAQRTDTLRTFRGETPSLVGGVGWFADHTVSENDKGDGTPRFIKWRPMPEGLKVQYGSESKSPSDDSEAQ
jgi:hypothetical protein